MSFLLAPLAQQTAHHIDARLARGLAIPVQNGQRITLKLKPDFSCVAHALKPPTDQRYPNAAKATVGVLLGIGQEISRGESHGLGCLCVVANGHQRKVERGEFAEMAYGSCVVKHGCFLLGGCVAQMYGLPLNRYVSAPISCVAAELHTSIPACANEASRISAVLCMATQAKVGASVVQRVAIYVVNKLSLLLGTTNQAMHVNRSFFVLIPPNCIKTDGFLFCQLCCPSNA